jgi:hypothetical protein
METDFSQSAGTRGAARTAVGGEPIPILALLVAVFACAASSVLWLWFTPPKPNGLPSVAVPLLVLVGGGVVVPMLVFFVGGAFGLFKVDVYRSILGTETHRRPVRSRRRKYYRFAALVPVVAMLSIMFHVPLYARFALSRPAMNALVADLQANPDAVRPATMRAGLFVVETMPTQRADGALMFHLPGDKGAGFTYSTTPTRNPGGIKGAGGGLGGGWYWFSND